MNRHGRNEKNISFVELVNFAFDRDGVGILCAENDFQRFVLVVSVVSRLVVVPDTVAVPRKVIYGLFVMLDFS